MFYQSKLTPAEKARAIKFRNACNETATSLSSLEGKYDVLAVVAIFEKLPRRLRGDVFLELDTRPRDWPEYKSWHPSLRAIRNSPRDHKPLYDLF